MQLYFYNEQVTTYYITTEGELFNSKTGKWLKGQINKNGYKSFNISIDGVSKRLYAHRMVAETYLPRIEGKEEVNHKDGNKTNNSVENLEWVSPSENKKHAIETGLRQQDLVPVYCFDKYKKLVCIYPTIAAACQVNGFNYSWLLVQLNREVKTLSHGYYWSRSEDNNFATKEVNGLGKPVGQYTIDGKLIAKFASRNECARELKCDKKRLGECCNGKIKTYRGYVFKYLLEDIV